MSARKSSHRTIFLIVSSRSPLALIASSLRSTSKKPVCPMTRSLHPPIAHCGQRVRFAATWREEFFEVPWNLLLAARLFQYAHRRQPMPTFMCFLNWTEQGAKKAKEANKRFQASKSMAEKLGGKLLSAYVTSGHYDVVLTLEMPNGEQMIKFASAIFGSGNARTTTVRAYTPDEFSKLAADAPTM